MKPGVSIIVPTWNEAENIEPLLSRIHAAMQEHHLLYEVIFVDDFSTDGTQEKITALQTSYPVSLYTKKGNRGKALSLLQGFSRARYKNLVMIDADLQYPPEAIPQMIALIAQGTDVVVTRRIEHNEGWFRSLSSALFRFVFIRLLHGLSYDVQSGLKAFTKDAVRSFPANPSSWTFDLEFMTNVRKQGLTIGSVDISFSDRQAGESKINIFEATVELAANAVALKFRRLFRTSGVVPFTAEEQLTKGKGFYHKGAELVHHTDLAHDETAHLVITGKQKIVIMLLLGVIVFALFANWHGAILVLFAALTLLYFIDLVFNFFLIYRSFSKTPAIQISDAALSSVRDEAWPTYTIFCPLYKEWQVVPQFIKAMSELDYPKEKLQVMLLLEQDDTKTIQKTKEFNLPEYFDVVVVPHSYPKTKPKAMNYGLSHAKGEFLVIYDAEDVPDPLQLKKAVLAFERSPANTVCVQAKLNFYNPEQNVLTRLFTAEYSLWFDLVLTGLQSLNGPIPLGGTSNHFRTRDLHLLNGWDAFNVTEDCDLGLRLFKRGYRTAIVESTTLEEANSDVMNWYRQRSRWIKGYIQTYLVHMRRPGEMITDIREPHVLTFQLVVGGKILSMFINPLMWVITALYFVFRAHVGGFIESFFPSAILYLGVFSFIFGNFLYLYYYLIGSAKRGQFGIIKYALLIPLYWLGMSIAAWRAVYEIIVKPHYWAKTVHGLHLGGGAAESEEEAEYEAPVIELPAVPAAPVAASVAAQPRLVEPLVPPVVPVPQPLMVGTPAGVFLKRAKPIDAVAELPLEVPVPVPSVPVAPAFATAPITATSSTAGSLRSRFLGFRSSSMSAGTIFVAAMVLSNFLNFVYNAFLGRTLTLGDFGTVTLFNTVLSLIGVALSALANTVNHRIAFLGGQSRLKSAVKFTNHSIRRSLAISLIPTALWIAVVPLIARFFQIQQLSLVILFTPVITLGVLAAVGSGYLRGRFLFDILAKTLVLESLSKLCFAVLIVVLGYHQWTALSIPASIVVSFAATALYTWRAVRADARDENGETESVHEPFPLPFFYASFLSGATTAVFMNVDVLLAKHFLSPEVAGAYSLLSLVGKMIYFFGSLLGVFITSVVSRHEGASTNPNKDFYKLFNGTVAFTAIAFLGVGVFGKFTVPILFGSRALEIMPYLFSYGLAMVVFTLAATLTAYHVAKREYVFAWLSLVGALAMIGGIMFSHGDIAALTRAVLGASVFQFALVFGWHALRKNTRFIFRSITDLLDVFLPLPRQSAAAGGKRILVFNWRDTKHAFAGGAEVYINELAKRWVESGNQVTLFCGNDGKSLRYEVVDGVQVVRRGGFYFVYVWAFFYYMFQFRGRYDVVIDCQNGIPFFTPLYVKEQVYCLMHHVHQEVFRKYLIAPLAWVARTLENRLMPWVYRDTQFITISNSSKAEMQNLGLGLAGMEIIHPGVDLANLEPGEKDPDPLVLYLGRLKAYKSVDVLIKAFQKVLEKIPTARLVVAGGGEEEQELRKLTKDLSLEYKVEFTGKITEAEKLTWLQRAWVFVNPSMMEGWGITSIEANACGVPVVAANVPGLRDSVKNPHTGYLVQHGDVDTFAARITRLLEHKEIRDFMAKEAVEWASNFDWNMSSNNFLKVLNRTEAP